MCTKNQHGTDKPSKHNEYTIFSRDLVFLSHKQNWRQLCFIVYPPLILLPHNFLQIPFWPPPLPPTPLEHDAAIFGCLSVTMGVVFLSFHPSAASVAPVRWPRTGTSRCYRVSQNCQRQQKTPLPLAGGPDHCSPPPLTPPHLSLSPLTPPPSPMHQANLHPCPHCFRRSPVCPPQNCHRPGRRPDQHPPPHRRLCRIALRPCWV